MNHSSSNIHSECSESAKNEIERQLEELKKHSGKDSNDVLPRPENIISSSSSVTVPCDTSLHSKLFRWPTATYRVSSWRRKRPLTKPVKNKKGKMRERLNATIIHTS